MEPTVLRRWSTAMRPPPAITTIAPRMHPAPRRLPLAAPTTRRRPTTGRATTPPHRTKPRATIRTTAMPPLPPHATTPMRMTKPTRPAAPNRNPMRRSRTLRRLTTPSRGHMHLSGDSVAATDQTGTKQDGTAAVTANAVATAIPTTTATVNAPAAKPATDNATAPLAIAAGGDCCQPIGCQRYGRHSGAHRHGCSRQDRRGQGRHQCRRCRRGRRHADCGGRHDRDNRLSRPALLRPRRLQRKPQAASRRGSSRRTAPPHPENRTHRILPPPQRLLERLPRSRRKRRARANRKPGTALSTP